MFSLRQAFGRCKSGLLLVIFIGPFSGVRFAVFDCRHAGRTRRPHPLGFSGSVEIFVAFFVESKAVSFWLSGSICNISISGWILLPLGPPLTRGVSGVVGRWDCR